MKMKHLYIIGTLIIGGILGAIIFSTEPAAGQALHIERVPQGGTGWAAFTADTLLTGNGTGKLATTSIGGGLSLSGGVLSATGGAAAWPFSVSTNYGVTVQSTTTALWFNGAGVFASSTSARPAVAANSGSSGRALEVVCSSTGPCFWGSQSGTSGYFFTGIMTGEDVNPWDIAHNPAGPTTNTSFSWANHAPAGGNLFQLENNGGGKTLLMSNWVGTDWNTVMQSQGYGLLVKANGDGGTATPFRVQSGTATSTILEINSSGNLGIGSFTSIGHKLVVGSTTQQNTARINGLSTANMAPILSLFRSGTVEWALGSGGNAASDFVIAANPNSTYTDASLGTPGISKLVIKSGSGNVGIGTSSPYLKLSVAGGIVGEYVVATSSTASLFPYASTTQVSATSFCLNGDATPCRTAWPSSGSGAWPFTTDLQNYGVDVQATTTPEWFQGGMMASSTSYFQDMFVNGTLAVNDGEIFEFFNSGSGDSIDMRNIGTGAESIFLINVDGGDNDLIIDNTGKVGISTAAPTYPLDVTGSGHFTSFVDALRFIATSSSLASSFPYASSTAITVSGTASTSKFFADGLVTCNSENMLTWSAGVFGCEADTAGAGGGAWPFTTGADYAGLLNTQSTTSPLWIKNNLLVASSTFFTQASTTMLTNSGSTWLTSFGYGLLGTDSVGKVGQIASSTLFGTGTGGNILAWANGAPAWIATTTIPLAGDVTGTLSSTVVGDNSHAHDSSTISGIDISADTNLTAGDGLTLTDDDLDCDTASASVFGCMASVDWSLLHTATTTFTYPLTYTGATNAVTFAATSTLYGTGTAGQVLMWSGTTPVWAATSTCEEITGSAELCDGDDATGAGGGAWPFTPSLYADVPVQATSTALWLKATSPFSLIASSTFFTQASTSPIGLTIGSGTYLQDTSTSTFGGPLIADNFSTPSNSGALGDESIAVGDSNYVPNINSASFGLFNISSGAQTITAGEENTASGRSSGAFGKDNITSAENAFAFGLNNLSSGLYSFSAGNSNIASDDETIALGFDNTNSGTYAVALGQGNTITEDYAAFDPDGSLAFGAGNYVDCSNCAALGWNNEVHDFAETGDAIAIGNWTSASSTGSHVIGRGVSSANKLVNNRPNSLYVGFQSTVPTFVVTNAGGVGKTGLVAIATSTPFWSLTVASSTGPQLALTDGTASSKAWTFRNISNSLYIATSTALATSTSAAIAIAPSGIVTFPAQNAGTCLALTGSAALCDGDDATGSGGGAWPFSIGTYNSQLTSATTTLMHFTGSPLSLAASTSVLTYASSTALTATNLFADTLVLTNDLTVANGGTGASTLTGLLVGNGTSAFTAIAGTTCTNQFLRAFTSSGGTCADVDLAADVTGTLPVANGGTNATALGAHNVLSFNGTSIVSTSTPTVSAINATSSVTSVFAAAPTFSSLTSAILLTGSGGLLAEYTGSSCTNQFPRSVNALGAWTCASVSLTADVTGTLPVANGGTNATAIGSHELLSFNGTNVISTSTPTISAITATSTSATSTLQGLLVGRSGGNFGFATSTPFKPFSIFGETWIQGATAGTSSVAVTSSSATKGGKIILQDMQGGTCTEIHTQGGVITGAVVTCP